MTFPPDSEYLRHPNPSSAETRAVVGKRPTAPCPKCNRPAELVSFDRPPRDATWDRLAEGVVPSWRIQVPGPFADVTLSCGDQLEGTQGVAWLELAARADRPSAVADGPAGSGEGMGTPGGAQEALRASAIDLRPRTRAATVTAVTHAIIRTAYADEPVGNRGLAEVAVAELERIGWQRCDHGDEVDRLRGQVGRVRELHRPREYGNGPSEFCAHDDEVMPCPTIQAIGGPDADSA